MIVHIPGDPIRQAATFEIAEIYRQLGKDIMKSERPKKLPEEQLEEYNSLLEEERVGVVPGIAFGPSGAGHVRVAMVQPMERLALVAERLGI